jgi:hypothetical protein
MKPAFWKVSMGPGGSGREFKDLLTVLDWIRQGIVLVHKNTGPKGTGKGQGELFVDKERAGDYFYLCHGNQEPSVILFGQFSGPANIFSSWEYGWAERPFRWIKTAVLTKAYQGERKWWTPNDPSTFVMVPEDELKLFESVLLRPYFEYKLADFGIET